MTEKSLRVAEYLEHIVRAIVRIGRYTTGMTEAEFCANEMVQDAVIRNIEIIGEAARNVARHHAVFPARAGMNRRLRHHDMIACLAIFLESV